MKDIKSDINHAYVEFLVTVNSEEFSEIVFTTELNY